MHRLTSKKELLQYLAKGALAITPNNRLSAALQQTYFNFCQKKTLDKPTCMPYSTLVMKAYRQLLMDDSKQNHPILLNTIQSRYLWQKVIKTNPEITYSEGLLQSVMQAWENCQYWQIDPLDSTFSHTHQTSIFQQWWLLLNRQLNELNAITEQGLIPYLIQAKQAIFSKPVIWICFDDFNPQQLSLQQHLNQQGLHQYRYDLAEHDRSPEIFAAKDTNEEYQQLILWLQKKIAAGDQKIGVVVPELAQASRHLQRLLTQHFDPAHFNISLGQKLAAFPLVAHAMTWLGLDKKYLNSHQAALLLQSPYLGASQEEFGVRSQFLQDSSVLQEPTISVKTLINELYSTIPKLATILEQLTIYPKSASVHEWITLFHQRLNRVGFPGDQGLNSENYQCYHRFTAVFDEYRQLGLLTDRMTLNEALVAFIDLLEQTIFQPQKTNALIQVSGLLEASGCEFDSLWVMGITDHCLPQKTRLSAFIPPQLQRELLFPHSIPARELHFAQQTLQRLHKGSPDTVFSYARLEGDNPNLPSSLIVAFPPYQPLTARTSNNNYSLIPFPDSYLIPIQPNELISGGTALLANQAKCPFKAFSEHRLKAKAQNPGADGLDNREKGQLIHKVMELLWRNLGSQAVLLGLDEAALEQHIDKAIHLALAPLQQIHPDSFPPLVQQVEYQRLQRLVLCSLEWEKQRPPFTIKALEESYTIDIAGLNLKVRVDRLDEVANKKWVIDYKSSLPAAKPWNEDRPTEPQLLLYALLDEQINTLILMQLKTGKMFCNGLSEEDHSIHGISRLKKEETWANSRSTWQQQLTQLAEEFLQGHCVPQPVSAALCLHCDFQNLCRFQTHD